MKIYRRWSDAQNASGGKPFITIQTGKETIHIIDIDANTTIMVMGPNRKQANYNSITSTGIVTAGHLDRLGNANRAEAAQPLEDQSFEGIVREPVR